MNADTGAVHNLDDIMTRPLFPGQTLEADMLKEKEEVEGEAKERLEALEAELKAGEAVVGVSEEVAHRQAVGARELERRKTRRRSSSEPPPGPPNPPVSPHHRPVG